MIDEGMGIPNNFLKCICDCNDALNSCELCGDDGGVGRVCCEGGQERQNAKNSGPHF